MSPFVIAIVGIAILIILTYLVKYSRDTERNIFYGIKPEIIKITLNKQHRQLWNTFDDGSDEYKQMIDRRTEMERLYRYKASFKDIDLSATLIFEKRIVMYFDRSGLGGYELIIGYIIDNDNIEILGTIHSKYIAAKYGCSFDIMCKNNLDIEHIINNSIPEVRYNLRWVRVNVTSTGNALLNADYADVRYGYLDGRLYSRTHGLIDHRYIVKTPKY